MRCPSACAVILLTTCTVHLSFVLAAEPVHQPTITLVRLDQQTGPAPVTFGMVFRKGEIPNGKTVDVRCGDQPIAHQVDIKRHHEDGSVRTAVISLIAPDLPKAGIDFAACDPKPATSAPGEAARKLLASGFDAVVTFTFPGGKKASASARRMLEEAGDKAATWLSGPVSHEFLLMGAPVDEQGKADPDLNVQFQVRTFANSEAVRISVVVENCWDTWAGNIGYDVTVKLGREGRTVLEKKGLHHERLSRWRRVFWWPAPPPDVHVAHDAARLFASRALPNFDLSVQVPEQDLADMDTRWKECGGALLGNGFLEKDMGGPGGRDEINYYPVWTVRYFMSLDPRAKRVVLGHGDLAGSWPVHVRNSKTKRLLTIDERPTFWLDERGEDRPVWKPDRTPLANQSMGLQPEVAHVGSFACVPYLLTGDFYYLEETFFWSNFCLLSQWPEPRRNGEGIFDEQIRGNAWGLRELSDAGFIAPDGSPESAYFEQKVRNNIAHMTRLMLGPPERNKLGFWGESPADSESNDIKDAANPRWMIHQPWQVDYLIWSIQHLVELGYADAVGPRDFLLRWRVGLLTHPAQYDPKMCTTYRMVVGERRADDRTVYYDDWTKLAAENARLFPKMPNFRDYYDAARGALVCAVDAGFPKAGEAIEALDEVVWEGEKLGAGRKAAWSASPKWSIVPRP